MIFTYFRVPPEQQHRVLFWGIFGAVVLRGIMIATGSVLFERFDWIVYVFGILLILSAVRMLAMSHESLEPDRNPLVRIARRYFPVTDQFDGSHFFTHIDGRHVATPLFLALVLVESSDVVFALDSIPAIFAVTSEPFIVFTSNIFAILGLRSLYFALAGLMHRFRYLKISLVFLLAYVGVKMLLVHHYPIPNGTSLAIIGGILSVGVIASAIASHRDTTPLRSPLPARLISLAALTLLQARRTVILVLGSSVLLVGIALIVLPGPAVLVIPMGLSILAVELAWARRWLKRIQRAAENTRKRLSRRRDTTDGDGGPHSPE
jgi:tellurite resistance protein TerC